MRASQGGWPDGGHVSPRRSTHSALVCKAAAPGTAGAGPPRPQQGTRREKGTREWSGSLVHDGAMSPAARLLTLRGECCQPGLWTSRRSTTLAKKTRRSATGATAEHEAPPLRCKEVQKTVRGPFAPRCQRAQGGGWTT